MRLEQVLEARGNERLEEFRAGILRFVPSLRAFALSLTRIPDRADDLVQETILRAWSNQDKFTPGTKLEAWLLIILRNAFFSELRKRSREEEDPDEAHALGLAIPPDQIDRLGVLDLQEVLKVEGLTYDEAAAVCGCAPGTIKGRVNRARHRLAELMALTFHLCEGRVGRPVVGCIRLTSQGRTDPGAARAPSWCRGLFARSVVYVGSIISQLRITRGSWHRGAQSGVLLSSANTQEAT